MELDERACYRALVTRDARFDGRFFTGVRTTGVYCRPICPARTPRFENCAFFVSAAAARGAGYRPCLRCRPEASPGTPAWGGTSATVSRALRLIAEGALDQGDVDELAGRLGMGSRHLRRLFLEHTGAPPVAVAQTRRLHFAKKLLDETRLSMTDVALGAGYASVRRFNAAFQAAYGRSPRELRREKRTSELPAAGLVLRMPYRAPFHWDAMLSFLRPRATPGVESVEGGVYRRAVAAGDANGLVEIRHAAEENALLLAVPEGFARHLASLASAARRAFDLGADPAAIAAQLERDARLRPLVRRSPGLRIPGAWDPFQTAVRAILGQQVSVTGATTLAGRLVRAFGTPLAGHGEAANGADPWRLFPGPQVLADANVEAIGMPGARAKAIRALARAVQDGEPVLDPCAPLEVAVERLLALPGLGPWTAQYIAMRALSHPDAFPSSDLGLRKALGTGRTLASAAEVEARGEMWRPWRGYAAIHLWSHETTRRIR